MRVIPLPPNSDMFITEENLLNITFGTRFGEENAEMAVSLSREIDWLRSIIKCFAYDGESRDVFGMRIGTSNMGEH